LNGEGRIAINGLVFANSEFSGRSSRPREFHPEAE
jgi:hypothetical protein